MLSIPMAALALAEPLDRGGDALGPGRILLGFGNPVEIVALGARREAVERGLGLGRLGQSGGELGMQLGRRLGLMLGLARQWSGGAASWAAVEDQAIELGIGRQVAEPRSACRTGPSRRLARIGAAKLLPAPEVDRRMGLEGGDHQQDLAAEGEGRSAPFERLLDFRNDRMDALRTWSRIGRANGWAFAI